MPIGEKDDEIWEVMDGNRQLTGAVHRRGDALPEGQYHLVVNICIFNSNGQMLIQKRQPWKKGWPNLWNVSAGGSATAGDTSQIAAERETEEEIGYHRDFSNERPYFTVNGPKSFCDYYLIEADIDISKLRLQYEEVAEVKWATKEEILAMIKDGSFVPYHEGLIDMIFSMRKHRGNCMR